MTSRERLLAAASGGTVDRKPLISWPEPTSDSDALVDAIDPQKISFKSVLNPFGHAMQQDVALWEILEADPEEGERVLHGYATIAKREIKEAIHEGYDGVLYQLFGATPEHTTPMEYGGHYLERDREILSEAPSESFNLVMVVGGADAYLDFVSDLPANIFAWETLSGSMTVAQLREMRNGTLATNSASADIELQFGAPGACARLEADLKKSYAI